MRYDLIVIGTDPAGQWGAIAAARLNKRVAIVEDARRDTTGLNSDAVSTETLREAIIHLTDIQQREAFGNRFREERQITIDDLRRQVARVAGHELNVVQAQLDRNGVDFYRGRARFTGPHAIAVESAVRTTHLDAERILVACGTKPLRPAKFPFDGRRIVDTDEILRLEKIPQSLIVIGGGVTGLEQATMFAALGVRVTVVDGRDRLLEFCDREIVKTFIAQCRTRGMTFQLGQDVIAIEKQPEDRVVLHLESGARLIGQSVLFAAGRVGDTGELDLAAAGLECDNRGRLWCSENLRTWAPHIYGVGDVVGFPARPGPAFERGQRVICHAFGVPMPARQPASIILNTVPEIAMAGQTERQLTKEHISYEVGIARVGDIGRNSVPGDSPGLLKLLVHSATRKLLGAHCLGEKATEIVQIGQSVMAADGTIDCFRDTICDDPALAERFKVADDDCLNKLGRDECFAPADDLESQVASQERAVREAAAALAAV